MSHCMNCKGIPNCPKCGHFDVRTVKTTRPAYGDCQLCGHVFPLDGKPVAKHIWLKYGVTSIDQMRFAGRVGAV